jgi:hypothetical protein
MKMQLDRIALEFATVRRHCANLIVILAIASLFAVTETIQAGPFADFFRSVKRAFTGEDVKPAAAHRTNRKEGATITHDSGGNAGIQTPPGERNTRKTVKAVATNKNGKTGLKYGAPVPGKQGFVTSPFSPDKGYIDVRGFPPGTPVKDPYSGNVILTP